MKLLRLLVAISVLVGSVASSPTFGHAHPLPDSVPHDHHDADLLGHSHSAHHDDGLDERDDDSVLLGRAVFHWHGVWFGIPFSVPAPAGQPDGRPNQHPLSEAYLTPAASSFAGGSGLLRCQRISPNGHGVPPPQGAAAEFTGTSLLSMPTLRSAQSHCALTARSGVLRC